METEGETLYETLDHLGQQRNNFVNVDLEPARDTDVPWASGRYLQALLQQITGCQQLSEADVQLRFDALYETHKTLLKLQCGLYLYGVLLLLAIGDAQSNLD